MKKLISLAALLAFTATAHAAVIAKIGSKSITDDDIRSEYAGMGAEQKKSINGDSATRRNVIENTINSELLLQEAVRIGIEKDAEYKKALERFRKQYLVSKMMEKTVEPHLTKSELKKFFEQNRSLFDSTEVCAGHIVVSDEATANKVLAEVKANGSNFEAIAQKNSLDPTVQENKGNLGCFTRDRMVAEFSAAAFSMKKGEIKGPVHTSYGFHVIKLNDVKPGKVPGFDEVEQKVKDTYRMRVLKDSIQNLRVKGNVKIDEAAAKTFKF